MCFSSFPTHPTPAPVARCIYRTGVEDLGHNCRKYHEVSWDRKSCPAAGFSVSLSDVISAASVWLFSSAGFFPPSRTFLPHSLLFFLPSPCVPVSIPSFILSLPQLFFAFLNRHCFFPPSKVFQTLKNSHLATPDFWDQGEMIQQRPYVTGLWCSKKTERKSSLPF